MKRTSFIAAGGALALASCGHAGNLLPALTGSGASSSSRASTSSARGGTDTIANDPAYPLPANPILGEVRRFDGTTPPVGWSFCDGSILAIASNRNLFSILGKSAGGDGRKTFALPQRGQLGRVICTSGTLITSPKMLAAAFAIRDLTRKAGVNPNAGILPAQGAPAFAAPNATAPN